MCSLNAFLVYYTAFVCVILTSVIGVGFWKPSSWYVAGLVSGAVWLFGFVSIVLISSFVDSRRKSKDSQDARSHGEP
jgi:ABC-type transport system involved in Fe-S cluster assembly fused permease/ATPase subunit